MEMSEDGDISWVGGYEGLEAGKVAGLELSKGWRVWAGPGYSLVVRLKKESLKFVISDGLRGEVWGD